MADWLNSLVYGLALAAVAWAVARPRLFDAAWRGRIWGAALLGVAFLTALPALRAIDVTPLVGPAANAGDGVEAMTGARVDATRAGGWINVPALPVPAALLLLVWASVALGRVAMLALAVARIRTARGASAPFPAGMSARVPEWTAANAGRFTLVLSDRVPAPSMLGFGRPMIAVPAAWPGRLSDEALDAILLHELAHAERRDDLFDLAQQLLLAACWPHPAAWWIARRIAFEREAACDERAVRLTTTRRYARCLVTIAEALQEAPAAPAALVASSAARGRQLARRVEHLLAIDGRARIARSSYTAAPVLAGIMALAAAGSALPRVFGVAPAAAAVDATVATEAMPLRAEPLADSPRPSDGAGATRRETPALTPFARRPQPGDAKLSAAARSEGMPMDLAFEPRLVSENMAATLETTRVVPIGSRAWTGHLVPPDVPVVGGTAQDNVEGRTEVSAPFRAVGSAFSRAGAGTGRWFSRAGASVASAVVSR